MVNREFVDSRTLLSTGSMLAGGCMIVFSRPWRSPERLALAGLGGMLLIWGATRKESPLTKSGVASVHHDRAIRIEKSISVNGPLESIYRIWRNPENLPCFVDHVNSVCAISDSRSHWVINGPAGRKLEWESEIFNERENESFAWHSLLNADINNAGSIHFRRLPDSGTEIRVVLSYEPPAGALGAWIAKLSGKDPAQQLELGLRSFKSLFEAGKLLPN